jgi:hypothetical protein
MEAFMKNFIIAVVLLVGTAGAAYAAAPETVHALAKACGLPCC